MRSKQYKIVSMMAFATRVSFP